MSVKGLVESQWLADNLENPKLRLFDCTVHLLPSQQLDRLFEVVSGRERYDREHIPGAGFIDVSEDLSAPRTKDNLWFSFPSADSFQAAMRDHGVDTDSHVVLYSSAAPVWATRVWWLLYAFGFENASVLNGGLTQWLQEGRPVTAELPPVRQGNFVARLQPGRVVGKEEVLEAIDDPNQVVVDSLSRASFCGTSEQVYGRPGHIQSAVNVSVAEQLINPETTGFVDLEQASAIYQNAAIGSDQSVICYCGGGISATGNAFLLTQLGYQNVAVYDNSMQEWGHDPSLPMTTE